MNARPPSDDTDAIAPPRADDWDAVRAWRRATRARLLEERKAIGVAARKDAAAAIALRIEHSYPELEQASVGIYWPIRAELDFRFLATRLIAKGATISLPVVVEKDHPVEFHAWTPEVKLERGFWNIPVPATRTPVQPSHLIVPVVGFDDRCYRLGYGGGYYDRTLASLDPRPTTIAIGLEASRLDTIYPQPHDIPMNAVVTESRLRTTTGPAPDAGGEDDDTGEPRSFASPPCFMHELGGTGVGAMTRDQTVRVLNELLEAERAGARGVTEISGRYGKSDQVALREVAVDEGRFCTMLARHIERLGGQPSRTTGAFYDKLVATDAGKDQLSLLNRGQRWVVRKLGEAIPLIDDDGLRSDLVDMLNVHERNIDRCDQMA